MTANSKAPLSKKTPCPSVDKEASNLQGNNTLFLQKILAVIHFLACSDAAFWLFLITAIACEVLG
jgi:hypothetical protein